MNEDKAEPLTTDEKKKFADLKYKVHEIKKNLRIYEKKCEKINEVLVDEMKRFESIYKERTIKKDVN